MEPTHCCDPQLNASCPFVPQCCAALIESNRRFYRQGVTDSHDIRFLHSTIYTIIGCVVAFMLILLLAAFAICRFHVKRRWSLRYYSSSSRSGAAEPPPLDSNRAMRGEILSSLNVRSGHHVRTSFQGRTTRGAARPHPPITLHDLDMYFASLRNVDSTNEASAGSTGHGSITYNINNGVQIVGAPPPYSQEPSNNDANHGAAGPVPSNATGEPPPPYVAEENDRSTSPPVASTSRGLGSHSASSSQPSTLIELNTTASHRLRRNLRRNRNSDATTNRAACQQASARQNDPNEEGESNPLLEMNNNAFNEGPVINLNLGDGAHGMPEEDGNNNGDINGNSEMVDLHHRRLQEEREREELRNEQLREREQEMAVPEMQERIEILDLGIGQIHAHPSNVDAIPGPNIANPEINLSTDGREVQGQNNGSTIHAEQHVNIQTAGLACGGGDSFRSEETPEQTDNQNENNSADPVGAEAQQCSNKDSASPKHS